MLQFSVWSFNVQCVCFIFPLSTGAVMGCVSRCELSVRQICRARRSKNARSEKGHICQSYMFNRMFVYLWMFYVSFRPRVPTLRL